MAVIRDFIPIDGFGLNKYNKILIDKCKKVRTIFKQKKPYLNTA